MVLNLWCHYSPKSRVSFYTQSPNQSTGGLLIQNSGRTVRDGVKLHLAERLTVQTCGSVTKQLSQAYALFSLNFSLLPVASGDYSPLTQCH
jgi:hypothetical protein